VGLMGCTRRVAKVITKHEERVPGLQGRWRKLVPVCSVRIVDVWNLDRNVLDLARVVEICEMKLWRSFSMMHSATWKRVYEC
jgi:hypothetical protein